MYIGYNLMTYNYIKYHIHLCIAINTHVVMNFKYNFSANNMNGKCCGQSFARH